mgnify:CR=1 FL=1
MKSEGIVVEEGVIIRNKECKESREGGRGLKRGVEPGGVICEDGSSRVLPLPTRQPVPPSSFRPPELYTN